MKAPYYESSAGATEALLATDSFVDIDCYTFSLPGSPFGASQLLYSAGDLDVSVPGGAYFSAKGPTFDQDKAKAVGHWKIGLDVDQWQVVIAPRNVDVLTGAAWPDQIGSQPWLAAAQAGALDGATVQVDRAFAPSWPAIGKPFVPTGIVTIFGGLVGEVDVGRSQAVLTIYSHLKKLANPLPRNLFQASCVHTLFDQGCTLLAANFAMSGAVAGLGATGNVFTSSIGAPSGSGTYALGRVTMTSGNNQGFSRLVRSWTAGSPGTFTLIFQFPFALAPGDGFTVYPGCDKRFGTCGQFNNQLNYGGTDSIPVPEVAV